MTKTKTIPDLLEAAHLNILQARSEAATPAIREVLNDVIRNMDIAAVLAEEWEPHQNPDAMVEDLYDNCAKSTKWDDIGTDGAVVEQPAPDYLTDWCRVSIGKTMWLFRFEEDGDFDGDRFVNTSKWVLVRRFNL